MENGILALRLSAYCAAEEKPSLSRLNSFSWLRVWAAAGTPTYRIGSLCIAKNNIFKERLQLHFFASNLGFLRPTHCCTEIRSIENSLAFELIFRLDSERLKSLDLASLTATAHDVNAFQYAAALGAVDSLSVLIDRLGLDSPLLVDSSGPRTDVLHTCDGRFAFGDRLGVLNLFLQHFEPLLPDSQMTMLESASFLGNLPLLSSLISRLGGLPFGDSLILASENGHIDCTRLLLEHGADVNAKDRDYQTPLMLASKNGHLDCTRLLMDHGADLDWSDGGGGTALTSASEKGQISLVGPLLERGASVDACGYTNLTALIRAAGTGHTKIIRLLLEHGADVNAFSRYGGTPLTAAADKGHTDSVRLLLEHGADVNAKSDDGIAALAHASRNGHSACVRLLMERVEDMHPKGLQTALGIASRLGHAYCVCLLKREKM